jgi:REP-associated tyrosine transposase
MRRAHRHYVPGYVWHITHRCHRRQFLLQFARDRRTWRRWLSAARQRYGLCVLDYTVTCNHIHLLVRDQGRREIAQSLQLIAGRTGQAYNQRKRRRGAFWEDRYHATAVDTGAPLVRCLVYVDLNMVRAGVVRHPAEWAAGGYHEIQTPPSRYRVIDRDALADALGVAGGVQLAEAHREWIATALTQRAQQREPQWTESLAVGRRDFVGRLATSLGARARHRAIETLGDTHILHEPSTPYGTRLYEEMVPLSTDSR